MKLSPPAHARAVIAVVAVLTSSLPTNVHAQAAPKDPIDERVETIASALLRDGVQLTTKDFEQTSLADPPADVAAAGEEYVAAWREYQRTLSLKVKPMPGVPSKNVRLNMPEYSRLTDALLESDKPPQPEDLSQFFYSDYGFCGETVMRFAMENQKAILLTCLRNKRYGEAVQLLTGEGDYNNRKVREDVLNALGFDALKVLAGGWLAGKHGNLDDLCTEGSEYAAGLALRWAELHWAEAVTRQAQKGSGYYAARDEPAIPTFELLQLLRDGNEVRPETKQQISEFLSKNATRLYDHQTWLQRVQPGTGKWLVGIAREALKHDKNAVRKLGEKVLHDAGEQDVRAELQPSARYRLFVDGELWPLDKRGGYSHLGLSVKPGGSASAEPDKSGVITVDPDHFAQVRVTDAYFYSWPGFMGTAANVSEPWIHARIPLPPAFGETTDIRIETARLMIKPKLPRPSAEYEGKITKVEFGTSESDRPPSSPTSYQISGNKPLVIERVQPGEYWFRVQAPGAAIMPWQRIQVTSKTNVFEPKLERGSTVVVPISWPESLKVEKLDPDAAALFQRRWCAEVPVLFVLEQSGKPFQWPIVPGMSESEKYIASERLILPSLPIGRYTLKMRSSQELSTLRRDDGAAELRYPRWKQAALSFEISAKSPADVRTHRLKPVLAE